jgi:hypothetical protein
VVAASGKQNLCTLNTFSWFTYFWK